MKNGYGLHRLALAAREVWSKIALALFIILIAINLFWSLRDRELRDFGSFLASGKAAEQGKNPYRYDYPMVFHLEIEEVGIVVDLPNLNPPAALPFFEILTHMSPHKALNIWRAVSSIIFIIAIILLMMAYRDNSTPLRIAWAISLAGFWHVVELGQIYTPILLFGVIAWLMLRSTHPILAGIFIGLVVTLKPNFVLWTLFLLLAGYHKAVISSIITFISLGFLPILLYGPIVYRQWMEASAQFQGLTLPANNSFIGLTARFGYSELGLLLSVILVVALGVWIWRRNFSPLEASSLGLVTSILASPIAWSGYTLIVLPIMFARRWSTTLNFAAANLALPIWIVIPLFQTSPVNFVLFGWAYGWGLCLILGWLLFELKNKNSLDIYINQQR